MNHKRGIYRVSRCVRNIIIFQPVLNFAFSVKFNRTRNVQVRTFETFRPKSKWIDARHDITIAMGKQEATSDMCDIVVRCI